MRIFQTNRWNFFIFFSCQDGFSNDPNYQPVQPTMQEVNELADELNRFLSSKSKHVLGSSNNGKGTSVNAGMITALKKTNGTVSPASSATSSAKASITAVNYSSVPKKKPGGSVTFEKPSSEPMPNMSSAPPAIATNFSSFPKNRPLTTSSSAMREEVQGNLKDQQKLLNHHYNHNQEPYPGQQIPSLSPSLQHQFRPTTTQMMVDSAENRNQRGGGSGGFVQNDLYIKSWHPAMVSPAAGGGIPVVPLPNHPYHHRTHNINNPLQSPPRPSSPAKINNAGKGTGYHPLSHQYENRVPFPKQFNRQHGYHHYQHDREEVDPNQDGDFVEIDENDVSGNLANLKREGEGADEDNNNDMVHNNNEEELEEGDEEEEEEDDNDDFDDEDEEEDNVANPGFLLEPKNFAADLETLFSLANHLYTSPASLISTFSALTAAKTNSTKESDNPDSSSSASTPLTSASAFQGLLKVSFSTDTHVHDVYRQ